MSQDEHERLPWFRRIVGTQTLGARTSGSDPLCPEGNRFYPGRRPEVRDTVPGTLVNVRTSVQLLLARPIGRRLRGPHLDSNP
jgi:hypothetical protein